MPARKHADGGPAWLGAARDHLDVARDLLNNKSEPLGPRPADLSDVITDLAIAGPAVCALRALRRVAPDLTLDSAPLREGAASMAWISFCGSLLRCWM